jgi:predicted esterase
MTQSESSHIPAISTEQYAQQNGSKGCGLTTAQILAITVPLALLGLFCALFFPIYFTQKKRKTKTKYIYLNPNNTQDNTSDINIDEDTDLVTDISANASEFDEFEENVENYTYAVLTPKNGYDNIYIFLGGIAEPSNKYLEFFKSNSTIIPKRTKIYFLSGRIRPIKFLEKYNITDPVPCWFNVDPVGKLVCDGCETDFDQAKESLNIILDAIDRIAADEKMSYDKIYLGGFSQGAIMTNYVMINSRHELGGYTAFSGYFLDHNFPDNYVLKVFSDTQKQILESKKNYHILATHSFNDQDVPYPNSVEGYYTYYKEFTDFNLYSFGNLMHEFITQPVLPLVRLWLKKRMGKE